ncbi:IclR family transcriptional regulator [Acinetobacter sp. ANC 4635]|uniref:IclR family transcriptional regulator domain-containing protein n=1 Tax=Acinetobacter sp. ANC 4635 TaxID=2529846 RepID=UPI0010404618|nr:IclR family transcriptional regulator C-terminal domain-containing protein [Acinetobacter sp. ANC 4635]TCB25705.1 IclR family transcriptional regulator [Acinetobacter sp. ANC 4635]
MEQQAYLQAANGEQIAQEDYIAGLAKGLIVLETFGIERQRLNITQISQRTGISRTAARRYAKTLKFLGFLDSDQHYFWLTPRVLRFSSAYLSSAHLPKIAQPLLNLLSVQTNQTFSVVVLDEHEVVPIARSFLPQPNSLRLNPYGMHLGHRLPAHATSTGKLLLAQLSQSERQAWVQRYGLKRLTPFSMTNESDFLQELEKIAQQDYCISQQEHELGIIALAVPIFDAQGRAIAALNCIGQQQRIDENYLIKSILPLLRHCAQEIRNML